MTIDKGDKMSEIIYSSYQNAEKTEFFNPLPTLFFYMDGKKYKIICIVKEKTGYLISYKEVAENERG